MAESFDPHTRATVQKIPLLTVKAGPRDKEEWQNRLKQVGSLVV
jgi:ufm1-conjugating enzyme 1